MSLEDVKKLIGDKKLVIGAEQTIKNLKKEGIKKVFLSSNCSEKNKEDIDKYAKISGAEVEVLNIKNEDLGVVIKKPFSISVLSILK